MSQSYYDLLGVPTDASTAAVEAAYRERVKETHPDRSDAPDASEQFKAVCRARDVLTDPQERARYDRLGHAAYVGERPGHSRPERSTETGTTGDEGAQASRERQQRTTRAGTTADGEGARADGFGDPFDDAWWTDATDATAETAETAGPDENGEPFGRQHAAANRSRSWYRPGADGSDGYRVSTSDQRGIQFTTERIGIALVTFALYPVFVASAFLPAFPLPVNLLVGLCTLALVVYLLSVPETGVLVFGGWTLLAPVALTTAGVGLLSGLGVLAWAFCWIPFVLAVANLLFLRA